MMLRPKCEMADREECPLAGSQVKMRSAKLYDGVALPSLPCWPTSIAREVRTFEWSTSGRSGTPPSGSKRVHHEVSRNTCANFVQYSPTY